MIKGCDKHLYWVWSAMKARCNNPNDRCYQNYGGRGIRVCEAWESSRMFMEWALANGYRHGLTIDRIDNNKGYSPDNCRWVDAKTQARNKSDNRYVTFNGETHCLSEWSEITGIRSSVLKHRLNSGWPLERAFTEKNGHRATRKPIMQLTKDGDFVRTFSALTKVKELGVDVRNVGKICQGVGRGKTIGGFRWKYCEALVPVRGEKNET